MLKKPYILGNLIGISKNDFAMPIRQYINEITLAYWLFTNCERRSQGVKLVGEIPWQASQRSVVLKKKKKKRGRGNPGMVQKPFPFGWELEKQMGKQKAKDKL